MGCVSTTHPIYFALCSCQPLDRSRKGYLRKVINFNANQELKTLKTMAAAMLANTWNKSPVLERTKEPVWIWNLTLIPTELTHPSKIVQSQAQILENRQKSA